MGATNFTTYSVGKNPNEAFYNALAQARYEHGHGGYTGTIAEKSEIVVIDKPEGCVNVHEWVSEIVVIDKPEGCVNVHEWVSEIVVIDKP